MRYIGTKIITIAAALSLMLANPGCKKNNSSETTRNYLDGVVILTGANNFVELGDVYSFNVSGVSHPEGSSEGHRLGLSYYVSGLMTKSDTLYNAKTNPLKEPVDVDVLLDIFCDTDTLGTFSMTVSIYSEDSDKYYASTRTISITTVDVERSIPELVFDETLPYVEDDRQLIPFPYNYTLTDNEGNPLPRAWMTRNMAYMDLGTPYQDAEDMSYLVGRYYSYDEALSACPEGWKLPSDSDWTEMANAVAGNGNYTAYADFDGFARHLKIDAKFNGSRMWEFWPASPCLGTSGLRVVPAGYCNVSEDNNFINFGTYAGFWTSDENPEDKSQAFFRYLCASEDNLKFGSADKKSMLLSVRCVAE